MEKIYPYAVSKIKARENNLLGKTHLEQLATENDLKRIVSILTDKGYNFEIVSRYEEFDKVLKHEEEELYKLVKDLVDENEFVEIFLLPIDYYNVKMILKAKIANRPYEKDLKEGGIISKEVITSIMESQKYELLDDNLRHSIQEVTEQYEKLKMPYIIDAILDKSCYSKIKKLAENIGNEFILKYIETLIDITNIKTFFRIQNTYNNIEILKNSIIDGGRITPNTFIINFKEDKQNLKNKFVGYSELIELAIYNYGKLDVYADNSIMKYMQSAKLNALTIEPIVAYIYAKQTEFKNIRIIFTGKLTNVPAEKIMERLRESYV